MSHKQLVKSTSGIRGIVGEAMNPALAAAYGAAFGSFVRRGRVVIGRDSRPSGRMLMAAATAGLVSVGIEVVDVGIVPTPTVEIAVKQLRASGGICITASHNPAEWNALKFFNDQGEFITPQQYRKLDRIYSKGAFAYKTYNRIGRVVNQDHWIEEHVVRTLAMKPIDRTAVRDRVFKVVIDAVNGAGSQALPLLLKRLGVKVIELNCEGNGKFVRGPEPVARNLSQLSRTVKLYKADLGMACDPDADRLALVDELGRAIGEELTLATAVEAVLSYKAGPTVINLSTSKATEDVARSLGSRVYYSKVGEANVVDMMRRKRAIIGGEGNGGVIYPGFHAGRDALIAAALVLSHLATTKRSLSQQVANLPKYYTVKAKGPLRANFAVKLKSFEKKATGLLGKCRIDRRDGLRFDFKQGWLQIRSSNTEPIFRVIVETDDKTLTRNLSEEVKQFFK